MRHPDTLIHLTTATNNRATVKMRAITLAVVLGFASSSVAFALPNLLLLQAQPRGCTAGHWNCNGTALQVCNGSGWVTSAFCGNDSCCSVTDGGLNAHCYC